MSIECSILIKFNDDNTHLKFRQLVIKTLRLSSRNCLPALHGNKRKTPCNLLNSHTACLSIYLSIHLTVHYTTSYICLYSTQRTEEYGTLPVTAGSTDWCCINLTPSLPLLLILQGSGRVGQVQVALPLDLIHRIKALLVVVVVAAVVAAAVVVVVVVAAAAVVVVAAAVVVIGGR